MLRDAKGGEAEGPEEEGLLSVPPEAFSRSPGPTSWIPTGHLNEQYEFKQNEFATKGRARPVHFN